MSTEDMNTRALAASKEIDEKLDELVIKVTRIDERLSRQPFIDEQKEKNIDEKFKNQDKRITSLEANQRWVVLAIIGVVIEALVQLVINV